MARGDISTNGKQFPQEAMPIAWNMGRQPVDPRMLVRRGGSLKRSPEDGDVVCQLKRLKRVQEVHLQRMANDSQQRRESAATGRLPVAQVAEADYTSVKRGRGRPSKRDTGTPTRRSGHGQQAQHTEALASPDTMNMQTDAEIARSYHRRMSGYFGLPTSP